MRIELFGTRVLVKMEETEKTTKTGLLLPDEVTEMKSEGVVVGIGSGIQVAIIGDTVLFGRYAGDEITMPDGKYKILDISEIFGKVIK